MTRLVALALLLLSCDLAHAQSPQPTPTPPVYTETVQVTASRIPEDVDAVPASIQVITAQELRDRGATDLKSALALAAGVDIAPGGDAGPASSVPEFWGLREFDAFLLVVDGVPWGGAFNPALSTLDLARRRAHRGPARARARDVRRDVVRRRDPGRAPRAGSEGTRVAASGGSYTSGSVRPRDRAAELGRLRLRRSQRDFERMGFKDERSSYKKTHLLWRNRHSAGRGIFSLRPRRHLPAPGAREPYSARGTDALRSAVPIDSNQNPEGAYLDEDRYFVRLGYDRSLSSGDLVDDLVLHPLRPAAVPRFPDRGDERAAERGRLPRRHRHERPVLRHPPRLVEGEDVDGSWRASTTSSARPRQRATPSRTASSSMAAVRHPRSRPARTRGIDDTRNFVGLYANLEWTGAPVAALRPGRAPQPHGGRAWRRRRPGDAGVRRGSRGQARRHAALRGAWA